MEEWAYRLRLKDNSTMVAAAKFGPEFIADLARSPVPETRSWLSSQRAPASEIGK